MAVLREAQKSESWAIWAASMALFAGSIRMMGIALGWALGVIWALTTVSLAAFVPILHPFFRAQIVGHSRVPRNGRRMPAAPGRSKTRLAVRMLSAGPLYLIAALALSLLIATKPTYAPFYRRPLNPLF